MAARIAVPCILWLSLSRVANQLQGVFCVPMAGWRCPRTAANAAFAFTPASIRRRFAPIVLLPEIRTYAARQPSLCRGPVFRGHLCAELVSSCWTMGPSKRKVLRLELSETESPGLCET